ncbi:unnamed protein product [Calypogeia fissa]
MNFTEPSGSSYADDAHSSIPPFLKNNNLSMFPPGEPSGGLEERSITPQHENETLSKIQRVKKKMSVFFSIQRTSMLPEEHELSSLAALDEEDLPSFHGNVTSTSLHESQSDQTVHPGKRKAPKTRKLGAAMQSQHQVHLLSNLHLIGITFFAVSGGPYGFEPAVAAGGPGLMLVGLLFFPVLWAAPLAYMTAELSCMIPESGGHVLWVYRAFGPFWSFVNSCFAFACSVLDNAMYPVLFVEYMSELFYEGKNNISYNWSIILKALIVVFVTIINILGVDIVGLASIILGLMVLAPLAIMCLVGLGHLNFDWMDSSSRGASGPSVIDWKKFFTLLLWNTSGFDAVGTCAAEVRNPSFSYPHALRVSLTLIISVYAIPTIIGISVLPNFSEWKEGTYMIVAKLVGGNFLKGWMGVSAASSALGLLLTRLCTNSRIVYGMALVEQVPPVFSKLHPTYATPWMAILATSLCTLLLTGFNFYSLAEADMLFYAFSTILKFAALVQLRFTEPDAFRPYRIPMETYPLAACSIIPIGLCISMIMFSSERAHGILLAGATSAILCFTIKEIYNQYGSEAEEAVNNRLHQIQHNMNNMQQRIDRVIAEDFAAPLSNLGQSIHLHSPPVRLGLTRQAKKEILSRDNDMEQGCQRDF